MAWKRRQSTPSDGDSRYLDRFGLLLTLVILTIVLASTVAMPGDMLVINNLGSFLLSLAAVGYVVFALYATGAKRVWRNLSLALLGLVLLVGGAALLSAMTSGRVTDPEVARDIRIPPLAGVLFGVIAFVLVVRRVLRHQSTSVATVLGAVAGYLLIPVVFFNAYISVEILAPEPLFGTSKPSTDFMYYSLTTLTTLGGELEARGDVGRLLTTSEAILGQLYLVVFVALIVGLFTAERLRGNADSDA